ncbi:uncharacterized protein LOC127131256 [Lathyrus oleraceus]|uniref:uncharacterized protein LOC127131256 n=1 Tax=Pisum sativum TaxID=3888 RepID=UPI0021D31139|nr:uncharacterized protein LOC127131256 [Pisum sativum]
MGAAHSFISFDCARKLNLEVSSMVESMVIDTPTNGLVTTSNELVGVQRVYINCFDKSMLFLEFEEGNDLKFMSGNQVKESLKNDAWVFMMFASLKAESKAVIGDLPVVHDFTDLFPDDVSDFPPKREVKFAIDLVPGTSLVSMTPYIMSV